MWASFHFSNLSLFCGALCRWNRNRVSDGEAEEDHQCRNQGSCIHPLSRRAQEAEACERRPEHLCVQTDHTHLKLITHLLWCESNLDSWKLQRCLALKLQAKIICQVKQQRKTYIMRRVPTNELNQRKQLSFILYMVCVLIVNRTWTCESLICISMVVCNNMETGCLDK